MRCAAVKVTVTVFVSPGLTLWVIDTGDQVTLTPVVAVLEAALATGVVVVAGVTLTPDTAPEVPLPPPPPHATRNTATTAAVATPITPVFVMCMSFMAVLSR